MKQLSKTLSFAMLPFLLLAGCSIVDHGNDYQASKSNPHKLITPENTLQSKDKLVIPFEEKIPSYGKKKDFQAPSVPELFTPFANLKIIWEEERMWIESTASFTELKPAIINFFTALHGTNPVNLDSPTKIETVAISFQKQSWIGSLWSSITRLYPEKAVYEVVFKSLPEGKSRIGLRYKTEQEDQNGVTESSSWKNLNTDERLHNVALDLWSALSTQLQTDSNYLSSKDTENSETLWLDSKGNYAIRLNIEAKQQDFIALVERSNLHLITTEPLQIAFVSIEEIPKVGDLKKLILPSFSGSKEIVIGSVRRRHLDDLNWKERTYKVELVRRTNGVFITVDTSEAEQPPLVSYQIMQELLDK